MRQGAAETGCRRSAIAGGGEMMRKVPIVGGRRGNKAGGGLRRGGAEDPLGYTRSGCGKVGRFGFEKVQTGLGGGLGVSERRRDRGLR